MRKKTKEKVRERETDRINGVNVMQNNQNTSFDRNQKTKKKQKKIERINPQNNFGSIET